MSALIKQMCEFYKREYGYDPSREKRPRQKNARSSKPISEILKEYPGMTLAPEFPDDPPTRLDPLSH